MPGTDIRSEAWKVAVEAQGQTLAVARIYHEGGYLPISTGPITLENEDYLPLLVSIPQRSQEIDWFTRVFSVSNSTLEILDIPFEGDTRFSDLLDTENPENRVADIRLWKTGITTWADCLPVFSGGKVIKTPEQGNRVVVQIEDQTAAALTTSMSRLTQADATAGYTLPEQSLNVLKPRTLGAHFFRINQNDAQSATDKDDWIGNRINNASLIRHLGGGEYMV